MTGLPLFIDLLTMPVLGSLGCLYITGGLRKKDIPDVHRRDVHPGRILTVVSFYILRAINFLPQRNLYS